ncbi:NAD-dependent epimerase/dehydratase family protein [Enterovirga aerilata]|uniref:NAD-dependent epimerase/dehydratase family protein n=1 Tax=Enterovirga aerilata TaxID=2730920 RepID=A0A849I6C1_9HYPH|nr:NAD-dependent epimerase/dehydratase family protein [Enterovirga sp. DB1703]NNM71587.1 NAD-dependent epimerase/dehydratase family protein [Enterovirga sp. DB1703]
MTTLITGAGGFIGLNVAEQLLAEGERVVALSLGPLHPEALRVFRTLPGRLSVEIGDICDPAFLRSVLARHAIRRVLHTAAITAGPDADPSRATRVIDVNVAGTNALLLGALGAGVERFVLTSSGAVYGDAPFGAEPVTEETPPRPASLYAITKLAAERMAVQVRDARGLDVLRTRLTAIYGPWEHDTGLRDTLSPPLQIAAAALRGEAVTIADGGSRDWTPGPEIARALVTLLRAERPAHDLYNLGCGRTWHPELLCRALAERFPGWSWRRGGPGEAPSVAYNDALDRPRLSPPSPARFEAEFGPVFRPPPEGAAAYAAWAAEHPALLAPRS